MNQKIKIPKKGDFGIYIILGTLSFIISLAYAFLIIKEFPERAIKPFSLYFILGTIIPGPIIWILCYYNFYKYYSPKFRTIEARSLMDMLALGEGKIYEVMDEHVTGFNLRLRYKELDSSEEYYVNLQVPDNEVNFFDFQKKLELLQEPDCNHKQNLQAISFYRIPLTFHVGYRFWVLKSKEELLFSVENLAYSSS